MSEKNLEIVRSIYADWAKGDFTSVEWADDDIEFAMPREAPTRGIAAMGRNWGDWLRAWDGLATEPKEFKAVGDRVVVLHEFRGVSKRSGIPAVDFSAGSVFTLREGKVVRLILCANTTDALKEAGLSE